MANGSRRTALGALLLTLGIVLMSAPSRALDVVDESTAVRLRLLRSDRGAGFGPSAVSAADGGAPSAAFIQFATYGGGDSNGKGLCAACPTRVIPEPRMLALIGAGLVSVGILVRRRLLNSEAESETA